MMYGCKFYRRYGFAFAATMYHISFWCLWHIYWRNEKKD